MARPQKFLIPARKGIARRVNQGQTVRVINTHGSQVVDFWAFNLDDLGEFMSMEHTRVALERTIPRVGDCLLTNKRRPILSVLEDASPGIHDTLIASCDVYRYELLGHKGYHENCTDNLTIALATLELERIAHPCPFNLFMNIPVNEDSSLAFKPSLTKPGDSITFRVDMDAVVAFSACPQDIVPINGGAVRDAHFEIR
jgi:uncharacterized protein